jgi:hypothetical protein
MSVIIQEVVGHEHHERYYPAISGIAQSYNFYPFSHMEPQDGYAVAAVGWACMLWAVKSVSFQP